MQKWEYLKIEQTRAIKAEFLGWSPDKYTPTVDLNKLGNEGWELVSIVPQAGMAGESLAGLTNVLVWVFKRPIA